MDILWQDQYFIAVCKQPGTLSEGDNATLSLPILAQQAINAPAPLHPVHRLDREVGGVLLLAQNAKAMAAFSRLIADSGIQKTYYAVTEGIPDKAEGELQDLLFHDRQKNKTYTVKRERRGVKKAALHYSVLAQATHEGQSYALLAVTPHTGRTHQIRVQFASRGLPLFGDKKYGAETSGAMGLFCRAVTLFHPITNQKMTVEAPLPQTLPFSLFDTL